MSAYRLPVLMTAAFLSVAPAWAQGFEPVRDKSAFLDLVEGRELRLPLFRIRIALTPDGTIEGAALGWPLTGSWRWQDGYFCRDIDWSGTAIPFNCQLVEAQGTDQIRFTVDQGQGESASFRLRPARGADETVPTGTGIESASASDN